MWFQLESEYSPPLHQALLLCKALGGEPFLGRAGVPGEVQVWSTGLLYAQSFAGVTMVWYICIVNMAAS